MRAYSSDLRARVIAACDARDGTREQIAARFSVSVSWIRGLMRRRRETGSIAPRPHGGGRRLIEVEFPGLICELERLIADEIAGDPMTAEKWVRSSTKKLSSRLKERGYQVGYVAVWRLLRMMGFSLKYNKKRGAGAQSPDRDAQFQYISSQRKTFCDAGLPIISVDTKKKELIGQFRNQGRAWCREPHEVNDHDFTSTAECRAVPYGVYDVARNKGYVTVGISNDTPEFAANAIARWWEQEGRLAYPGVDQILILADCGGTNGCRHRAWKLFLEAYDGH
jgi:transposase